MLSVRAAVTAFVDGWTCSRHTTGTTVSDINGLTYLHFGAPDDYQAANWTDEFLVIEGDPTAITATIDQHLPNTRHRITVFTSQPSVIVEAYAAFGYTLRASEYLMAKPLSPDSIEKHDVGVQRVTTPDQLAFINESPNPAKVPPRVLTDPSFALYYVEMDGMPVAQARSVLTAGNISVADMVNTLPDYRRRGISGAIMNRMLDDAAKAGATDAVLVATEDGQALYRTLGYTLLTDVRVFVPAVYR